MDCQFVRHFAKRPDELELSDCIQRYLPRAIAFFGRYPSANHNPHPSTPGGNPNPHPNLHPPPHAHLSPTASEEASDQKASANASYNWLWLLAFAAVAVTGYFVYILQKGKKANSKPEAPENQKPQDE